MGKIADNAEQQKQNNAAPQQKICPWRTTWDSTAPEPEMPPATGERAK